MVEQVLADEFKGLKGVAGVWYSQHRSEVDLWIEFEPILEISEITDDRDVTRVMNGQLVRREAKERAVSAFEAAADRLVLDSEPPLYLTLAGMSAEVPTGLRRVGFVERA